MPVKEEFDTDSDPESSCDFSSNSNSNSESCKLFSSMTGADLIRTRTVSCNFAHFCHMCRVLFGLPFTLSVLATRFH